MTPKTSARLPLVRVPWTLLSVGTDGRSLEVLYRAGGCVMGNPVIAVHETTSAIAVTIEVPNRAVLHEGCPDVVLTPRRTIRLDSNVRGRRITGPRLFWARGGSYWKHVTQGPNQFLVNLVPRLVGLSPHDARRVLASQGFRYKLIGPSGKQIVRQDPQPGKVAPSGLVTIAAGP